MIDFDSLESGSTKRNDRPIWTLDLDNPKSEKDVLAWLNAELQFLEKENEDRIRTIKHNIARYKGIQYQAQDTRSGARDREAERAKFSPKLVVNLLHTATEQRISRLVKFKPAVAILPANDEHQDQVSSKIAKSFLDYIQYTQKFEIKNKETIRIAQIAGEAYLDICWNPDLGKLHPDYDENQTEPLLDENGNEVKSSDGEPVQIESPVHVGDVEYKIRLPMHVFLQKAESYECAQYAFIVEKVSTDELRREYPQHANVIKSDVEKSFYNITKLEDEKLQNESIKVTFQFKKNKFMPKGRWIVFTKDVLLENGPHKYEDGDFSFERLPDLEIPGEQHAISFFENAKHLNAAYNNLVNMIVRNQALVAHPKWFVPRGSVKLESLGNDITIAQYQGAQPPVLAQQNPTPPEVFNFLATIKEMFMEQATVGDVMRGDPPKGITAGVSLQFLAEQEYQIANSQIVSYNEYVRRVAHKTLQRAGQFYDPSDKRTMLVLGQNKAWVSMNFDPSVLARPFDIRIQNSSALPDSKAARTQYILDMAERFPTLFPQEQIVEMLDLGQSEKFMDDATKAIQAAEAENEKIMQAEPCEPPTDWEAHILHWRTHFKAMQDSSFKSKKTPEPVREAMKDHVRAHEMLMIEMATKNPGFAQELQTLTQFPLFFEGAPPPPPPMPPEGEMMPPDAGQPMPPEAMPPDPMSMIPSDMQPPAQLPPDQFSAPMPSPVGEEVPGVGFV